MKKLKRKQRDGNLMVRRGRIVRTTAGGVRLSIARVREGLVQCEAQGGLEHEKFETKRKKGEGRDKPSGF